MADFMTAVRTVNKSSNDEAQPFLTPVSTQAVVKEKSAVKDEDNNHQQREKNPIKTPEDALQFLRAEPDTDGLVDLLRRLASQHGFSSSFDIRTPGPLQAQITNTLVTSIVPTFWPILDNADRLHLVSCLRTAAGTSAIVARSKLLSDNLNRSKRPDAGCEELAHILSALNDVFKPDDLAYIIWSGLGAAVEHDVKRQLAWKEFIGLVASGRLTSTVARSEDTLKSVGRNITSVSLLASGLETSAWLGRNVAELVQHAGSAAAQLLAKALGLGYPHSVVKAFFTSTVSNRGSEETSLRGVDDLLKALPPYTKRALLEAVLGWLSTFGDSEALDRDSNASVQTVNAMAFLVNTLVKPDTSLQQHILQYLVEPIASTLSNESRRACVVVIARVLPDEIEGVLEKLMTTFGEKIFIDHAPIVQQESIAKVLLLMAGYLHRNMPMALLMTARSSGHLSGVSNRLHSSNERARWLGMVVGTALSSLVDKEGSQMSFGTLETQSDEAKQYENLVKTEDNIGTVLDLRQLLDKPRALKKAKCKQPMRPEPQKLPIINGKQSFGPVKPPTPTPVQTEVIGDKVMEIEDGDDEEEDDLKPYAKPDSDPEDSDEDATLVNRNKTRPPVYIRDLMRMLKEDQNHDRFQMAIKHAPGLIRRKANFGNEVKDHAEELCLMLCDLRDPFETEDFDELKLQSLIAIVLAHVPVMGPWLSKQVFTGDYSLSQRCIMLSALGLGGRELAGYTEDDLNPTLPQSTTSFPTKRLPSHLHAMYSPTDHSVKRLEAASKNIEHQLIKPLALSAADKSTAHLDAVKVRTFSSRMEVERTKRKPVANQLAKVVGDCFFFPLMSRYQQEIAAYGPGSVFVSAPFVLVTFLKTLALILHAAGPATTNLPEISTAFWDLLLSLRVRAIADISVLEAVLFSLLTLLEVNSTYKQRLAQETPKQLMETQQWVELVFEKTGGGSLVTDGSDEETRVRTLAAGVLMKTKEIIEAYQKLLIGNTYG